MFAAVLPFAEVHRFGNANHGDAQDHVVADFSSLRKTQTALNNIRTEKQHVLHCYQATKIKG